MMKVCLMVTVKNDGGNFQGMVGYILQLQQVEYRDINVAQNVRNIGKAKANKMVRKTKRTRKSRIKDTFAFQLQRVSAKMSVHFSASNLACWHCCATITHPHKDDWSERFIGKWHE